MQDTTKRHHTSYVRGSIEGTEINILVDSGSTESFISADLHMAVPALGQRPLNADFIAARAVNGQIIDTLGTITATQHLGLCLPCMETTTSVDRIYLTLVFSTNHPLQTIFPAITTSRTS